MSDAPAVVMVKGSDPGLRARALTEVTERFLGDDDPTLALGETTLPPQRGGEAQEGGSEARQAALAAALDGARTPPFGTERRVVVVRSDDGYLADEAGLIAGYLDDPEPTTVLILEMTGRVPAALSKAAKAAGLEEIATTGGRNPTAAVLTEQAKRAGLKLHDGARDVIVENLGEDAGRVPALLEVLAAAFGEGARLTADDVAPYLGEQGSVPVFELTKAIDAGDVPQALMVLRRLTGAMGMHPLQVMAILHNHFRRVLRLDDLSIRNEDDAVAALGGKVKAYPAKLAWQRARSLGTDGIRRAFDLLADADVAIRGGSGTPDDAVVEVLVTRLAVLGKGARRATRR